MKSIILGTAGHIDHGKTALVKALTGIDADRLQEEKRRGITIDLGFAHMQWQAPGGETLRLGFVDVPGHERFVRNMLAGVGGIDLALLVIAADESIKPQTREHLDILQLLGVQRGITVLTKSDAVDRDMLEVVRLEVEEFLRGTFLDTLRPDPPTAPIIAVSSLTGEGLDNLKQEIARAASDAPARDSRALARLPIDRVFTMKGFGTVVTGTLVAGTISREEELEIFPTGERVRVRGVQVHGKNTDVAAAGERTALNLAGAAREDLARGMTLVPPARLTTTHRADARLQLLPSAQRALKNRARVHLHSYTMETVAEVAMRGTKQIAPGEKGFVELRMPDAALLLPGDRFIIRQFSPVVTIGGGVILDANPLRRSADRSSFLTTLASGDPRAVLLARIGRRQQEGISLSRLVAETGWQRSQIDSRLAESEPGTVLRAGDLLIHTLAVESLKALAWTAVAEFHKKNPLVAGINRESLREQLHASPEVFATVLEILVREKKLGVAGELVHTPGRGISMKDDEAESKKTIEDVFAAAGLRVPALPEVLGGLKVNKSVAQKIMTLLLRDKTLIKVSDDLVFHRSALDELRRQLVARKASSKSIDVRQFKELTGVSRKYAIPLLEYLDRERVTRRAGDAREIL